MTLAESSPVLEPLSDIAYHGYLLLLAKMDSEWGRRCKRARDYPVMDNHQQMRRNCLAYGRGINANYLRWKKGNGDDVAPVYLKQYLYNPMSFFPIGHADDACLVLTDDDPPAHHLTMRISRKIEDIWLADCPRMTELTRAAGVDEAGTSRLFCEPHELFDPEHGPELATGKDEDLRVHSIQRQTPFMVFTRYRIDGLFCVTHFLLAQQALYKVMIRAIGQTVQNLREWCLSDDPPPQDLLRSEDVDSLRCCLLDLRGAEEIGVLAFCKNISVAASLVARLRRLQYWQVLEVEKDLRRLYQEDYCLRLIVQESLNDRNLDGPSCLSKVEGNHVFRWTDTSVLVAPQAFMGDDQANCHGLLHMSTRWQAAPGHDDRAKSCLRGQADAGGSEFWQPFPLGPVDVVKPVAKPRCEDGPANRQAVLRTQKTDNDSALGLPYIGAKKALEEIKRRALRLVEDAWNRQEGPPFIGRHWLDFSVDMVAPVAPMVVLLKGDPTPERLEHHAVLEDVLSRVQARLWPRLPSTAADVLKTSDDGLPLDMYSLCRCACESGLPTKLRQTIESLYQVFFTVLSDPLRFDMVLDLYDAFATLHRLLAEGLWREMRSGGSCEARPRMLNRSRVHQIEEFVRALENALRHRTAKVYMAEGPLDMAVDFRGGLNQVLLATSAPMLCSLELFRKCLVETVLKRRAGDEGRSYDPKEARGVIGVISEVSMLSGLAAVPVLLGHEQIGTPQLCSFRSDVPHHLHIASHANYLHETGHLVFRNVFTPIAPPEFHWCHFDQLWPLQRSTSPQDQQEFAATSRRLGEVFAMFFSHVFLFESECTGSMLHQMALFARSLESIPEPDGEGHIEFDTMQRFLEAGVRMYLVRLLLPSEECVPIGVWLDSSLCMIPQEKAEDGFLEFLDMVGQCHPGYESLMRPDGPLREDLRGHARLVFRQGYGALGKYLPWVFRTVAGIHRSYRAVANLPDADDEQAKPTLTQVVDQSLLHGRPILRSRLRMGALPIATSDAADLPTELGDPYVAPLCVITRCLKQYITVLKSGPAKRMILDRGQDRVSIDYPLSSDRPWYEFQIDEGTTHMFCPVPNARSIRTRKQIVIRKTMRDVAATLQGQRLYRIVYDTLRANQHSSP